MRTFHRDQAVWLMPKYTENEHGQTRTSWDELYLGGLRITPVSSTEADGLTEATHTLRAPVGLSFAPGDRIRWWDDLYVEHNGEIRGRPLVRRGVSGSVAHVIFQLVEGPP